MNTVGKKDQLGAGIRCVVSVSMLTEGWDANNVTHILGIRAFGTQLLCEQVIGRALRRQSVRPQRRQSVRRRIRRHLRRAVRLHRQAGRRPAQPAERDRAGEGGSAGPGPSGDSFPARRGLSRGAADRAADGHLQCRLGDGADAGSRRSDAIRGTRASSAKRQT